MSLQSSYEGFAVELVTRTCTCAKLAVGPLSLYDRYGWGGLTDHPALRATCSGDHSEAACALSWRRNSSQLPTEQGGEGLAI